MQPWHFGFNVFGFFNFLFQVIFIFQLQNQLNCLFFKYPGLLPHGFIVNGKHMQPVIHTKYGILCFSERRILVSHIYIIVFVSHCIQHTAIKYSFSNVPVSIHYFFFVLVAPYIAAVSHIIGNDTVAYGCFLN